jgi:predicted transcriptional regulator
MSKIKKLYDLAIYGHGHEASLAMEFLIKELKKRGMTIEDLKRGEKREVEIKIKGKKDRDILILIAYHSAGAKQYSISKLRPSVIYMNLTEKEEIEIRWLLSHYRKEWREYQDAAFTAFLNLAGLTIKPDDDEEERELTERGKRALRMMALDNKIASPRKKLKK